MHGNISNQELQTTLKNVLIQNFVKMNLGTMSFWDNAHMFDRILVAIYCKKRLTQCFKPFYKY